MSDREKIIKDLEFCVNNHFKVELSLATKILAMLKEQKAETVESIKIDRSDRSGAILTGYCPSCKKPLKSQFNKRFCGECGKMVMWE